MNNQEEAQEDEDEWRREVEGHAKNWVAKKKRTKMSMKKTRKQKKENNQARDEDDKATKEEHTNKASKK